MTTLTSADRPWPGRWVRWCVPVLIVVLGYGLRVAFYRSDYAHPDDAITREVVGYMRSSGDWDTDWAKADLPPGLRYHQYNFSSHLYATYFFYRLVKPVPGLESWRSAEHGQWVYRYFSVLLATVVVAQTWWLTRRAAGERAAGFAGLLAAVVPLLVQDAHLMRPEAFVTALTLAAIGLSWPEARWRPGRSLAAAGVVGLLVACKVSLLPLIWIPLVPALAAVGTSRERWRRLAIAAGLTAAGTVAGFALGAPGAVAHHQHFWHGVEHLAAQYRGLHPPHSRLDGGPVGGMLVAYFASTFGAAAVLAGALGAAYLVRKRAGWICALTLGPVAGYAAFFSTRSVFFERNLSHVVPLGCLLAGVGAAVAVSAAAERFRWPPALLAVAAALALMARPADLTRRLVWIDFAQEGTRQRNQYQSDLQARHPGVAWWTEVLLTDQPVQRLQAHFKSGGAPVVLRAIDYHGPWSERAHAQFHERLDSELLGQWTSPFADVPPCTLQTYHGWTDRWFLVRGPRTP